MFRQHRREVAAERHVRAHEHTIAAGHRDSDGFVVRVAQACPESISLLFELPGGQIRQRVSACRCSDDLQRLAFTYAAAVTSRIRQHRSVPGL